MKNCSNVHKCYESMFFYCFLRLKFSNVIRNVLMRNSLFIIIILIVIYKILAFINRINIVKTKGKKQNLL